MSVARECASTKEDDLFADNPPLLVLRLDYKCALLRTAAKGQLCIELPQHDELQATGTHFTGLRRPKYSTRDASQVRQEGEEHE